MKKYYLFFMFLFFTFRPLHPHKEKNEYNNVFLSQYRPVPVLYEEKNIFITNTKYSYPVIDVAGSTQDVWSLEKINKILFDFRDDEIVKITPEEAIGPENKKYVVGNVEVTNYNNIFNKVTYQLFRPSGKICGGVQNYTIDASVETLYIKADTNIASENILFFSDIIKNLCLYGSAWRKEWFQDKTWEHIETFRVVNNNYYGIFNLRRIKNLKYLELVNCKNLISLDLSKNENLEIITIECFDNLYCNQIEEIIIPNTVKTILFRTMTVPETKIFTSSNQKLSVIHCPPFQKFINDPLFAPSCTTEVKPKRKNQKNKINKNPQIQTNNEIVTNNTTNNKTAFNYNKILVPSIILMIGGCLGWYYRAIISKKIQDLFSKTKQQTIAN